ncbi:MAG: acetate--CoA ligase family protein [Rickettsiales bacterium]|jgi:acetyltransferase|nr:acetate--CoA ligase family protein [Rickettsiales bacterium]
MLENFFDPQSIAVVGVSSEPTKLGSVVFNNIISAGYKGQLYAINPKTAGQQLYGKDCIASIRDLPTLDLAVVVVPAKFVLPVIEDCVVNKTKNIAIITAGFSEVGEHELENTIAAMCRDNNINLLGPNCLGYISTFSNVNASFADGNPERGDVAFISQSGAFCCAMLDWARSKKIGFSHFISVGNKACLSESELLEAMKNDKNTNSFFFYLESLKDGQKFLDTVQEVVKTKPVVILEPGKSAKAQAASLSHTGSLAPNYRVLENAFEKTGIIQAHNTREMFGLLEILQYANHKDFDGQVAIVTNAGGIGVLTSDLCEENGLNLPKPSEAVVEKLKQCLTAEAALGNPIDVIGDARADRYEKALRIICESKEYKNVLVLLSPQMVTDAMGTAQVIADLIKEFKGVNIFPVFVGGEKVKPAVEFMQKNRIVCFDYPTDITTLLGLLKKQMSYRNLNKITINKRDIPEDIKKEIEEAVNKGLASLPQITVDKIMDLFKIDYPKSGNFIDKSEALTFCKALFPKAVVLKLSAPDALHKTEMKGIYLNVDSESKFEEGWEGLWSSIKKFNLSGASVLVQEMITKSSEVIIGVNKDDTFGKVMLFGTGGVYTEVMKDTSLRVLPTQDFDRMISETKIGTILKGVRGETPKAVKPLADTMAKVQEVVLAIPQIKSIDINPILVTEDRAVVVDFKMILK